ncbi:conserved exported protein of unknown function [Hyphomicrobium sp. 1Nfss2.1]|uniref:hypothetical protein n=1 Tax=Hyphomicrobium sp. 1Nfss2.1 TaxID=3413936 RepID=UPI003C7A2D92
MNAHASSCFVSLFVSVIAAPISCAQETAQQSSPVSENVPAITLPAFLDAARAADFEAAWRGRFASASVAAARPIRDPEDTTIDKARATLSRAEQMSVTAAAVRDRAEELSRRFAAEAETAAAAAAATRAADEVVATVTPAATAPAETGSATGVPAAAAADADTEARVTQVSAQIDPPATASIAAPVSMLGGPPIVDEPTANSAAPVIEEMAAKPAKAAKRAAAATRAPAEARPATPKASTRESYSLAVSTNPTQPDQNIMMPTELRAFGWGSQPN